MVSKVAYSCLWKSRYNHLLQTQHAHHKIRCRRMFGLGTLSGFIFSMTGACMLGWDMYGLRKHHSKKSLDFWHVYRQCGNGGVETL